MLGLYRRNADIHVSDKSTTERQRRVPVADGDQAKLRTAQDRVVDAHENDAVIDVL